MYIKPVVNNGIFELFDTYQLVIGGFLNHQQSHCYNPWIFRGELAVSTSLIGCFFALEVELVGSSRYDVKNFYKTTGCTQAIATFRQRAVVLLHQRWYSVE